jgi:hypothetical protein
VISRFRDVSVARDSCGRISAASGGGHSGGCPRPLEPCEQLALDADVITGEDPCQTPKKRAALNLASIRTLGLLKRHPAKIPMKRKIKKAPYNNDSLLSILR